MKKLISLVLTLAMVMIPLSGCGGDNTSGGGNSTSGGSGGEVVSVRIAHSGSEDTMMHRAWLVVEEYLENTGNFDVTIYPNGTLGGDQELQEAVQNGEIEMSACSTSALVTFNPDLNVFSLPFAFDSEEIAYAVLDGAFGQKMLDSMEASGFKALGYFESCTYRELSSNTPVHTPADLAGVKIRVIQSNLHVAIWEALGAIPSPISFSELYTALQQGTVDAQDNPLELIVSQRFYEVQDYVTLTNHLFQVGMATCNLDWFNNLSAENQQYVQEAIQAGVEAQRTMAAEENEGYITTLEEAGLTVIELTDDELQQFKDRMGNAEQVIVDEVGQDLVDELKAAIEEASAAA